MISFTSSLRFFALCAAFAICGLIARAQTPDPTGTWKWSVSLNGNNFDSSVALALKDGKLTGSIENRAGTKEISDASFANGEVAFSVVREFRGRDIVTKYRGHLEGDTIKGTIVAPKRGGGTQTVDWNATREKK